MTCHRRDSSRGRLILFVWLLAASAAAGAGQRLGVAVEGVVRLTGGGGIPPQTIVQLKRLTDASVLEVKPDTDGKFRFDAVPAGRFSITVSSPGYIGLPHGSRHVRGLEVAVAVDDMSVADLALELVRTSSVSGFVRDRFGSGMSSTRVSARRWMVSSGLRTLSVPAAAAVTDAFGRYRLSHLSPGTYVVSAVPAAAGTAVTGDGYLETYHPSATNAAEARVVEVPPGLDVEGVDIDMPLVHTFGVRGRLVAPPGATVGQSVVWAVAKGRENSNIPQVDGSSARPSSSPPWPPGPTP